MSFNRCIYIWMGIKFVEKLGVRGWGIKSEWFVVFLKGYMGKRKYEVEKSSWNDR